MNHAGVKFKGKNCFVPSSWEHLYAQCLRDIPYLSQVLNLFMGGEDSPSRLQEDKSKAVRDEGSQLTNKAHVSPSRTPLLQKLNRMHGDSVILVWFLAL
jgi:hypothetical protein